MWQELSEQLQVGDVKAIARSISLVENEVHGYMDFLQGLPIGKANVIGITGPPGAGKSTLVDALIEELLQPGRRIAVLCIDPSSPFNFGALLGDRIRMSQWYETPSVYIRSLASRGSIGGLNEMIIEITAVLQAAGFDYIIVETVGIGQSEIEIAGLADTTVLVLVPEGGDEIQTMKAGVMEIADVFVVNKSDRPGSDNFVKNLRLMLAPAFSRKTTEIPIIKTVASDKTGITELAAAINNKHEQHTSEWKAALLAQKAWHILQRLRMKGIDPAMLRSRIEGEMKSGSFNLFSLVQKLNEEYK